MAGLMFALSVCAGNLAAADRGTAAEAVALVKSVIIAMKSQGKQKTLDEVNAGKFVDRDLYVAVVKTDGISMGTNNPRILGKNVLALKDADGKAFVKMTIDEISLHGKGWIDYKWVDPVSQTIVAKSTYGEKFEDLIVTCGIYASK